VQRPCRQRRAIRGDGQGAAEARGCARRAAELVGDEPHRSDPPNPVSVDGSLGALPLSVVGHVSVEAAGHRDDNDVRSERGQLTDDGVVEKVPADQRAHDAEIGGHGAGLAALPVDSSISICLMPVRISAPVHLPQFSPAIQQHRAVIEHIARTLEHAEPYPQAQAPGGCG